MGFRVIAKHRWVAGAIISEAVSEENTPKEQRRFTATIRGYRNWKIAFGKPSAALLVYVVKKVKEIRDCIDAGDEKVFYEKNRWKHV